jgi:hypothetical protein
MNISLLIGYSAIFSVLIPLSVAMLHWNKIPRDISALRWLFIASLISDGLMIGLGSLSIKNLWVGDVFMFIQFSILLYVFSFQFARRNIFKIIYAFVALFYLFSLFFLDKTTISLVGSNAIDGLILIIVSILFFYKLLNELKIVNVHRLPILWIAFGTLFYYSGNLFVFLAASYLEQDPGTLTLFWILHNALNTIKNILFAVALWQSYRAMKLST